MSTHVPCVEKIFANEDLQAFASLSGDRNPIHMDVLAARRVMEGSRVVHGILLLLFGLEQWTTGKGKFPFQRIKCDFKRPVLMGERAVYDFTEKEDGSVRIMVLVEDVICAEIDLLHETFAQGHNWESGVHEIDSRYTHLTHPLEWADEDLPKFTATLSEISSPQWNLLFPRLCKALDPARVSALSQLSYIVGMACPGLYSLFASLDVTLNQSEAPVGWISAKSEEFDQRFNLLTLALNGDLFGTLKAYRRPKPFQQSSMDEVKEFVLAGEFVKCNALIIGGSRGLGEMTAKILCAGGGTVHLGYAHGKVEAGRIASEIKVSDLGFCDPIKFDIFDMDPVQRKALLKEINSIYYFPTPPIFKKQAKLFHERYFDEFVGFYVKRFFDLVEGVEAEAPKKVVVFFPSTSAIDIRPRGMTVYAMAKAAAEILIQDVNRSYKKVEVIVSRLPKLGSDQTNTFLGSQKIDNGAVLLPIIRKIRDRVLI